LNFRELQSAKRAPGSCWKLRRYSGSRKIAEKRDCSNWGFGTTRFEFEPSDQVKIKS